MKKPLLLIPLLSLLLTSCLDLDEPKITSSITVSIGDVSFVMCYVPNGSFTMGANDTQVAYAKRDEYPTHKVSLGAFYICQTEITANVWNAVMNDNLPGASLGFPATGISYNQIDTFITLLSLQTGYIFALPTEAQWEYAARGASDFPNYLYAGSDNIKAVAVHDTTLAFPVGKLAPNSLDLYDMSGNVAEWCYDWYGTYSDKEQNMPIGPETGTYRVVRGGSYLSPADNCRVSARSHEHPDSISPAIGFRLIVYPMY